MRLDQKLAALSVQPLLGILEPAALHILAFSATPRALRAGEELCRAGEAADGGFLVLQGRLRAEEGEAFGPGALIGDAALFAAVDHAVTLLALEPTQVLELPRALMTRVLEEHPASALALNRLVAQQLAATHARLKALL